MGGPVVMDNDRTEFRCPACDACRWHGDLLLPGGLVVTCLECGWSKPVQEIEKDLRSQRTEAEASDGRA